MNEYNESDRQLCRAVSLYCINPNGDLTNIKTLLENSGNVNISTGSETPLSIASSQGLDTTALVELLVAHNAEVNYQMEESQTFALQGAVVNGKVQIVKWLLKNGADIHLSDNFGDTVLHVACRQKSVDLVRLLLENGAEIDRQNDEGCTALIFARHTPEMVKLLLESGASVNLANNLDQTPLFFACCTQSTACVELLIEHSSEINFFDKNGASPLQCAVVIAKNKKMVKILLEHNADVSMAGRDHDDNLLHMAVSDSVPVDILELLAPHFLDINAPGENGNTALTYADSAEVAKFLLDHSADVNKPKTNGPTPLMIASSEMQSLELVQFLLEHSADTSLRHPDGRTALMYAANFDNVLAIDLLIQHGADVNAETEAGICAMDLAESREAKKLLRQHGAKSVEDRCCFVM